MMSTSKYTSLFASVALIAALAACSDSTDSDGSDTASDSETTTESTDIPTEENTPPEESTEPPVEQPTGPEDPTVEPSDPADTETGDETTTDTGEITMPTDALEYADAFVVAWGNGNTEVMELLATAEVIDALGDEGGPSWDRTASDAGAGSVFITYTNLDDGSVLELRVQNEAASLGEEQAVVEARFTE
ncbi:hypothetical protein EJ997_11420 [Flaviflexus ciconiae]|uniref:Uncharacterized protein n=1 Tax=Flaviflexus ciconiae TaxID=2496867 RepID=A0A3Q9G5F8_9ACTO|nr:hypothetical protein [Flaviflexus ciconiae]AZQ77855.1 hypothetical protein EJ997_11420 [Flaviflexus ciconiae]